MRNKTGSPLILLCLLPGLLFHLNCGGTPRPKGTLSRTLSESCLRDEPVQALPCRERIPKGAEVITLKPLTRDPETGIYWTQVEWRGKRGWLLYETAESPLPAPARGTDADSLIGTWRSVRAEGTIALYALEMTYSLKSSNRFSLRLKQKSGKVRHEEGVYRIEGNRILFNPGKADQTVLYFRREGDCLILQDREGKSSVWLKQ